MITEFERTRDRILREIDRTSEASVRRALIMLDQLRKEVLRQMRAAGILEMDVYRMRQLQVTIFHNISQFQVELTALMRTDQSAQFDRGIRLVDQPLDAGDIPFVPQQTISRETLYIAQQFSADLITGLTNDLRAKINNILRRVALGGLTFQQALTEIGKSLTSAGAFSSIAARAEAIVRTELLRIQAQATQMRMEQQATQTLAAGYELRKAWLATKDKRTRLTHWLADRLYGESVVVGAPGPIPVDKEFIVGGEKCLYPRDPRLSAKESVNCRCASQPVMKKVAVPVRVVVPRAA